MSSFEDFQMLSQRMYALVPDAAARIIADVHLNDFKDYLSSVAADVQALIAFMAASTYLGTQEDDSTQFILQAKLTTLTTGFVSDYMEPRGLEYTKNFLKTIKIDDSLTAFGYNVIREAKLIASVMDGNPSTLH